MNKIIDGMLEIPKYTKYELSKMVKEAHQQSKLSLEDFSKSKDVESKIVEQIEMAERSFNLRIYNACARILNMNLDEVLATEKDSLPAFRAKEITGETMKTVELANLLFHEMVMQEKTLAR